MGALLQDILELEYPFIFLISVTVAIIVVMFSAFYFDQRNRKQVHKTLILLCEDTPNYSCLSNSQKMHQQEVNLKPSETEEVISSEEQSENDDHSDSQSEDSIPVEEVPRDFDTEELGAGGEEVVGLMSRLKNARLKEIEEALTEEQRKSEKE